MKSDPHLLSFSLGTFHTVLLTALIVFFSYLTVDLGEALGGLNTAVGLGIFGALWATSVYCAHRGMRDAGVSPGGEIPAISVLKSGATWGAWNGLLFFWCLLAGGLVVLFVTAEGAEQASGVLVFGLAAFGAGTIASYAAGSFLGLIVAVLDLELLWAARKITMAGSRTKPQSC